MKYFIILAIVISGFVLILNSSKNSPQQPQKETPTTEIRIDNQEAALEMNKNDKDKYVSYTAEEFENAISSRRVLFFYANWCPLCKPADVSLTQNETRLPEDVVILRVNYNDTETDQNEKELAKKYGITYQHTFVQVDSDGKVLTKWNGGKFEELMENLK